MQEARLRLRLLIMLHPGGSPCLPTAASRSSNVPGGTAASLRTGGRHTHDSEGLVVAAIASFGHQLQGIQPIKCARRTLAGSGAQNGPLSTQPEVCMLLD